MVTVDPEVNLISMVPTNGGVKLRDIISPQLYRVFASPIIVGEVSDIVITFILIEPIPSIYWIAVLASSVYAPTALLEED